MFTFMFASLVVVCFHGFLVMISSKFLLVWIVISLLIAN